MDREGEEINMDCVICKGKDIVKRVVDEEFRIKSDLVIGHRMSLKEVGHILKAA